MHPRWRLKLFMSKLRPWLLFGTTIALAAWFRGGATSQGAVIGFAETRLEAVAPSEPGRLIQVAVQTGQEVVQGQLLARLDPAGIDAELGIAEAERLRLAAELRAVKVEAQGSDHQEALQLLKQVDSARVELAREQVTLTRARARADALRPERDRLRALVAEKLGTAEALTRIELEYVEVEREVESLPHSIEQLEAQVAHAQRLRESAPSDSVVPRVAPVKLELEQADRKIAWLKHRKAGLDLRATAAGQVAEVLRHPGDVLASGDVVVTLAHARPSRVLACLPEAEALSARSGARVTLEPRFATSSFLSGRLVALGPMMQQLPERCRSNPAIPVWGRTATILLEEPADVLPGQAFYVYIDRDARDEATRTPPPVPYDEPEVGMGAAAAAGTRPTGATPIDLTRPIDSMTPRETSTTARVKTDAWDMIELAQPITLPTSSPFHLEPSGIVWVPTLGRYLVVSDDTGTANGTRHAPFLFSLSSDAQVAAGTIPVSGVAELNDLESIALAPDGTLYVLASQSYDRNGRRDRARTAMLELRREGEGLGVSGEVHLAELIEAGGPSLLSRLGLENGTQALDVEGMCFFDGALYFGIKAPLTPDRQSLIWHLDHPEQLFSTGRLEPSDLSLYARVRLDADLDGKAVPAGISELLFLPDGSLLLTSTPSGHKDGVQSGRLWRVDRPSPGPLAPTPVRTFTALKPEGLSLSPVPGRLRVVFDAGAGAPSWMELPWPR